MFLENKYLKFNGLNLSIETLEGLLKHNGPINNTDHLDKIIGLKNLKNNCVIMDNIFLKEQNLIQFYPTLIKKFKFNDKFKFVYVGEIIIDDDTVIDNLWNKRKTQLAKK